MPTSMLVQVEFGRRGRQSRSKETPNTTNPTFTTVAVDGISTQLYTQGLDPDPEDLRTDVNIQTDPRTPFSGGKGDPA